MKRTKKTVCAVLVLALGIVLLFASCGKKTTLGTEAELVSATGFTKEGTALSLTVPNGTESFSFVDKIEVSSGATWQISADPYGMGHSLTKTVSIHDGDNDYYLFVTSEDGKTVNRYTISIWCEADWYVVKDGVITGVTASFRTYAKNVEIPSEVNGEKITGIGKLAFCGCTNLTSITIPEGIASIGPVAFVLCTELNSVVWNAANCSVVRSEDETVFEECYNLTTVTFGGSVEAIPRVLFCRCFSLTSVTIPEGVTSIGSSAFWKCTGLTAIHYQGTKAQWDAINKGNGWDEDIGSYVIHCTDGDIAKGE